MKRILIHLRTSVKFLFLIVLSAVMIVSLVAFAYKPIYSVTFNGELIGYCEDKVEMQKKINSFIENGESADVAFVQIDELPEYELCLLKKGIVTNDDEILNKIKSTGTEYYHYYAINLKDEEKYYVSNFSDSEEVIKKLKDKKSTNIDDIRVVEKYEKELKEFSSIDTIVNKLYVAPVVEKKQTKQTTYAYRSTGTMSVSKGANNTRKKVNIGINLIKPLNGTISSGFGGRWGTVHKGLDIAAPARTPIKAAAGGTVKFSGWNSGGYGNLVIISHGNGVETYYAHCSSVNVTAGQKVSQGQVISKVGNTGNSYGNHCHFEVRVNGVAQNPRNYTY